MVEYKEGHKNSKGEDAPWCIVSHENGRVISSHKSRSSAESHLKDIQMFKHMKNESMLSPIGFKNRVVEILSNFDQFKSKIWREGGRVITVNFRTAQFEGAEELGKLMTRALNGELPGYKAELVGVDRDGSEWFADIKFKKEENMRESIDFEDKTYEDLLGDYVCIRSYRHGNMGEVCRKGYHYKVDEIATDGRVVINGWYVDLNFLNDHFEKVEDKGMTIEEAKEILSKSGRKMVNESYLEDAGVEELYELAGKSLQFADQVHCWHWCCQSGFQHTHFEAIYDALRDFADELVEVSLASGKNIRFSIPSEIKADSTNFEPQEAVEGLEDFLDEIQATGEKFEDYSEITAVFDDISKTLSKEIGLIKNFA